MEITRGSVFSQQENNYREIRMLLTQILLSFTFLSYSLGIVLKLKADFFFYPQDKQNEIHSLLLLLQALSHDLFLYFNCHEVDRSPRKVRIQPGEEKGSLHVLWVVLQAHDEILD